MTLPDETFGPRAKCKFCHKDYATSMMGIRHLRRHMHKCMPAHGQVDTTTQTQLQWHLDGSVTTWQFDDMHGRECLARYIAQTDQPISVGRPEAKTLTTNDWYVARVFVQSLKIFYNATATLSGVYYPTSSQAIHQIVEMAEVLNNYREDEHLGATVVVMETKLKKYLANIPLLYTLSVIVDPRVKLSGLEVLLEFIGTNLSIDYSEQITNIRTKLFEIFHIYDSRFGNIDTPPINTIRDRAEANKLEASETV
ncbi:hypothetical protein Ddye_000695 [Dipteronia dyeriana]|uniref:BED-type domain-containing protein n=1 Tax=Dipteronia dyeriana TaxID=168575 RepID=A0AAD9XMP6_9ROSI|nr:hypothetical protein Ddye_000695 [Dipteronia dyeriana]